MLLQVGDLTGPFGLSFVMVWLGAGLALAYTRVGPGVRLAGYSGGGSRFGDEASPVTVTSAGSRVKLRERNQKLAAIITLARRIGASVWSPAGSVRKRQCFTHGMHPTV